MEAKDRELGEIMVEMCYISQDHLEIALEVLEHRIKHGRKYIGLGEILVSDGFITRSQLKKVIEELAKRKKG